MNQVQIHRYGLQNAEGENALPLHERTLWLQATATFDDSVAGLVDLSAYGHEGGYRLVQGSGLLADLAASAAPGVAWAQGALRDGVIEVSQDVYESETTFREATASHAVVMASGKGAGRVAPQRALAKPGVKKGRRRKQAS